MIEAENDDDTTRDVCMDVNAGGETDTAVDTDTALDTIPVWKRYCG